MHTLDKARDAHVKMRGMRGSLTCDAGGLGGIAFARAPNVRVGPPSGGDAGSGGSVWLLADPEMRSLQGVPRLMRAGNGEKVSYPTRVAHYVRVGPA